MFTITRSFIILMLCTAWLGADTYKVDVSHSQVAFKVRHMMVSTVSGKFDEFHGTFEVFDGKLIDGQGTVQSASVNTAIEKRDNHLRADDFFAADKFPAMSMKLQQASRNEAKVALTIRGVTKVVDFDLEMGGEIVDPWGNKRAGFTLEGKINRRDFGLKWNKLIEAGGVAVSDKVRIIIEVEGIAIK